MDKIIALVGESGSGKTTIALELEKLGYNFIESYSTRKPRYEDERGHTFVKDIPTVLNPLIAFKDEDKIKHGIIAYTYYENEHYWATIEQYKNKGTSIYCIDPAGVKTLKKNVNDAEIVVIYLRADYSIRHNRMIERMKTNNGFNFLNTIKQLELIRTIKENVYNRLYHDTEAFKLIECNYCIDANRPLEEVLELVKQVIEGDKLESN